MSVILTRRQALTAGLAGLAALAVPLSGCSSSSASGGSTSGGNASGGTLTLIQNSAPTTLDPAKANAGNASQYVDLAYSSLLTLVAPGSYKPLLADSYEFVGAGNKQFQIKLRSDVKFSDGASLDSTALKKYIEYFLASNAPMAGPSKQLIDKIETPDATTVTFHFTSAYPDAPLAFTEGQTWGSPLSPDAIDNKQKELGFQTFGAGPYMVDQDQSTAGSTYTYVPNPHYFDKSGQMWDKVEVKVIANANAGLQAVTTSKAGFTFGSWQQEAAAKAAQLNVGQGGPQRYMLMITDRGGHITPALGEEKVRQAINFAIDRDAIAAAMHGTANEQIVDAGAQGYFATPVYSHDVHKAKQLLAEAGYANGFTFEVVVPSYDATAATGAQAVASDLAKAGITMKLITAPTFQQFLSLQGSKKYSADFEPWGAPTMYSAGQSLVLPTGNANVWKDSDDELNTLFDAAAVKGSDEATSAWEAFGQAVVEKAWFAPVATVQQFFFSSASIALPATSGSWTPVPNPVLMAPAGQ